MKQLSEDFCNAARDYLYLLNRNYPQKALIKLIGDRYCLSGTERSMLYRGICSTPLAAARKTRIVHENALRSQIISIDAYNVLITIGSYLNGNAVFISNDHFLRDASEIHGKVFRSELLQRALNLVFDYFQFYEPKALRFLIDSPVSHSGNLCAQINQVLAAGNLSGEAKTHPSPDYLLKNTREGIIATSDSTIIDNTQLPAFDLPHHVLCHYFEPVFFDLSEFV